MESMHATQWPQHNAIREIYLLAIFSLLRLRERCRMRLHRLLLIHTHEAMFMEVCHDDDRTVWFLSGTNIPTLSRYPLEQCWIKLTSNFDHLSIEKLYEQYGQPETAPVI